jgi:hypothetical protein
LKHLTRAGDEGECKPSAFSGRTSGQRTRWAQQLKT